jgi:hypothetical protein
MRRLLQATKICMLVLVLICLATACGSSTAPSQTLTTAAPSVTPSPAPPKTANATPGGADLTALLSQVRGDVTVVETSGAGEQTARPVRPMQVLAAGATVRVPGGAQAGLICSTERWIDLAGPSDWQLAEAACAGGRDLPAGTFKSMAPKAGRILFGDIVEMQTVESQTKEKQDDYGRIPVILSPRNTSLLELVPELRWAEVSGAIEYVLSLSGMKGFEDITLNAAELKCVDDPLAAPNRICSLPWPASQWPLEPGQRYFLTVAARTGVAEDLRPSEKSALRTLAGDAAGDVQAAVAEVEGLGLDAVTQDLRLASLYAEHSLLQWSTWRSAMSTAEFLCTAGRLRHTVRPWICSLGVRTTWPCVRRRSLASGASITTMRTTLPKRSSTLPRLHSYTSAPVRPTGQSSRSRRSRKPRNASHKGV